MLCLLKGDFKGYAYYNPMAAFLCSAVWLMLNVDLMERGRRWAVVYAIAVATINFLFWLWKILR